MQEVAVRFGVFQRHVAGGQNVRAMLLQLGQEHRGAEHEHAAVPQISTRRQVLLGHFQRRLFLEGGDRETALVDGSTALDVTKTGFGVGWRDAERHQMPFFRIGLSLTHRVTECFFIMDMVVGSQHQKDRIATVGSGFQSSQSNGWRGVASQRLKNDPAAGHLRHPQLLSHDKTVLLIAHDDRG